MTDHVARPGHASSSERVAELHRLADEDYAKGQQHRAAHVLRIPTYTVPAAADAIAPPAEPSDLDVAIRVAQDLIDSDQLLSVREALRLLLRALGAEPTAHTGQSSRADDGQRGEQA